MAKVGRFVTDPQAGAYCYIALDSREKVIVNHVKGGFRTGKLTIEVSKLFGFSSDNLFTTDLDSAVGKAILKMLTRDARPDSADATPLGAFVKYIRECASVTEVKAKCAALTSLALAESRGERGEHGIP